MCLADGRHYNRSNGLVGDDADSTNSSVCCLEDFSDEEDLIDDLNLTDDSEYSCGFAGFDIISDDSDDDYHPCEYFCVGNFSIDRLLLGRGWIIGVELG